VGIGRVVVTHPMLPLVGMSTEQQKEAANLGAFLEYPFNATLPGGDIEFGDLVRTLRAIGVENAILSSDLGQVLNPIHTDGLLAYFQQLKDHGFTEAEIDLMAKRNPAIFLGIE